MTCTAKPYSQACEENKAPIRDVLAQHLGGARSLLEIGSGTGQHAVYFAAAFPALSWQASDVRENLPGIRQWLADAGLPNLQRPLELDVTGPWPEARFDAIFSANSAHIMSDAQVVAMFRGVPRALAPGGLFFLYGPFNYAGAFTSESNARFDGWLKACDPLSGIKDFEHLDALAREGGMVLVRDHEMPVNNRTLVWRREV
jgi:cyclopropane fatty-acyl-phospholipid synthase-like methyltransferase